MFTKLKKCIQITTPLMPKKRLNNRFLFTNTFSSFKHFSEKSSLDNQKYNPIKIEKK